MTGTLIAGAPAGIRATAQEPKTRARRDSATTEPICIVTLIPSPRSSCPKGARPSGLSEMLDQPARRRVAGTEPTEGMARKKGDRTGPEEGKSAGAAGDPARRFRKRKDAGPDQDAEPMARADQQKNLSPDLCMPSPILRRVHLSCRTRNLELVQREG